MELKSFLAYVEAFCPPFLAEEWDKVGLQIHTQVQQEVQKVLLCLDVTPKILERVKEEGFDLVLSHHPLFFGKFASLCIDKPLESAVLQLIMQNTAYYAAHTNLDAVPYGIGDALLEYSLRGLAFEPQSISTLAVLSPAKQDFMKKLREQDTAEIKKAFLKLGKTFQIQSRTEQLPYGYGRVVRLKESLLLSDFIAQLQKNLSPSGILQNFSKDEIQQKFIQTLAFSNGAFDETWISLLKEKKVDVLVTGEIKHHVLMALKAEGIAVLCVGHGTSEIYGMEFLKNYLEALALPVEVFCDLEEHRFL